MLKYVYSFTLLPRLFSSQEDYYIGFVSSRWVGQNAEPYYFHRDMEEYAVVYGHYNSKKGVPDGLAPFNMRQDVSWEFNPMQRQRLGH